VGKREREMQIPKASEAAKSYRRGRDEDDEGFDTKSASNYTLEDPHD
jgi:hypothetical protein